MREFRNLGCWLSGSVKRKGCWICVPHMDAIISVDEQQRIVVFNYAAEKMFLCTASKALGSSLDRFIPAKFREVHRDHIRRFGLGLKESRYTRPVPLHCGRRAQMTAPRKQRELRTDPLRELIPAFPRDIRVILGVEHHNCGAIDFLGVLRGVEEHAALKFVRVLVR
jgi:PAS domain S-box-containing protein